MKNVQDIYPVSPMQEFMLLHAVAQKTNDTLFNQFCYSVDGEIDTRAFQQSWQHLVDRHAVLRSAFVWTGVRRPQQVVRKSVTPAFVILDWRERDTLAQASALTELREQDRAAGFDLRRAPLLRFTLVRLADRSWYFIWSSHHLILDRWCLSMIMQQFDRTYASLLKGEQPERSPAPSFRAYILWIQQQKRDSALQFWRNSLGGCTPSTALALALNDTEHKTPDKQQQKFVIFDEQYQQLAQFARLHGVTVGTVIQGAYALVINQLCNTQDAIFGTAVAGRPVDVPYVEEIVGSFINNVPVRVQMPATTLVAQWLKSMQAAQFGRHNFEYLSPADIHKCSGLAERDVLFDSLLVWLAQDESNKPVHPGSDDQFTMTPAEYSYATAFPLTLSIEEHARGLVCRADTRTDLFLDLSRLMTVFQTTVMDLIVTSPHSTFSDLPHFVTDSAYVEYKPAHVEQSVTDDKQIEPEAPLEDHAYGREAVEREVMEDVLINEWQHILQTSILAPSASQAEKAMPVDGALDTDFFELGGDSIQAALLHSRIEAVTRKSVPLLALFQQPTIRGMATILIEENWPLQAGYATALRAGAHGAPLFCIASPEVNTVGYSSLSRYLPEHQNVYVLQAPPQSQRLQQLNPSALPALAQQYASEMRKIQPQGPYRLLSMCAGSHITLHMARLLEKDDAEIEFFGIINTWALYTISRLYYLNRSLNVARYYRQRIVDVLRNRFGNRPSDAASVSESPAPGHSVSSPRPFPAEQEIGPTSPWIRDVGFAHKDPKHEKIHSTVSVFRLRPQQFWRVRDHGLGWFRHAKSVQVVPMPGYDHDAMMREPRVRDLATAISQCLASLNHAQDNATSAQKDRRSGSTQTIEALQ